MIKYDLHSHTQYSDGSLSVHALIALAIERGISHLAITDHDTVEAHLQLTKTNNSYVTEKINIIKGIELSSQWNNMGVHIVGLNIDIHSTAITTAVKHQTQLRIERVKTIAKKLLQRGFPDITQGAMILAGDGQVGRPHIAPRMVEGGRHPGFAIHVLPACTGDHHFLAKERALGVDFLVDLLQCFVSG